MPPSLRKQQLRTLGRISYVEDYERKYSTDVLEILRAGVVVEVETAQTETVGEATECVQAVGLDKKTFRLIPNPPKRHAGN